MGIISLVAGGRISGVARIQPQVLRNDAKYGWPNRSLDRRVPGFVSVEAAILASAGLRVFHEVRMCAVRRYLFRAP
jgi:hypothetical protein